MAGSLVDFASLQTVTHELESDSTFGRDVFASRNTPNQTSYIIHFSIVLVPTSATESMLALMIPGCAGDAVMETELSHGYDGVL